MPLEALCFYLEAKHEHETRRDYYMMDCLWAMATDRRFTESDEPKEPPKHTVTATYPRWHEILHPELKSDTPQALPTKDDIKARIAQLKTP